MNDDEEKPEEKETPPTVIYNIYGNVSGDLVTGDKEEGDDIAIGSITDSTVGVGRESATTVQEDASESAGAEGSPAAESSPGGEGPTAQDLEPGVLYDQLVTLFNLDEMRTLCFELNIDFDDIAGSGKSAKARELVLYMQRRGQLERLYEAIQKARG